MIFCQYKKCNNFADYDIDYDCEGKQNIKICKPHFDADKTFQKFILKKRVITPAQENIVDTSLLLEGIDI